MYRIEHKEHVITDAELRNYSGLEYDSAMCLREMQLTKYRHNGEYHKATYEDLMRSSALLCFISENKITTEEGFKIFVNDADEKYRKALEYLKERGVFGAVSGVLAGKPMDGAFEEDYKELLVEVIDDPQLPVLCNINIGHALPHCIMPFGMDAAVDADEQVIRFKR